MNRDEQRIAAFLEIWETNPDKIWETSGAINHLQTLNERLVACQNQPDSELATVIKEWCRPYPELTQKLMSIWGERKLRGCDNDSPQTEDNAIINQYPEITKILRERTPKMGKKEGQSQSS